MKFLKLILAVLIIGLGAAIGWYIADSSNPYKPEKIMAAAATPSVALAAPGANNAPRQVGTPIPTFTPATGTGASGANNPATPGAGTPGAAPGTGQRAGGVGQVISGTVEAYDATAKTLTVKTLAGQSVKVNATNATVVKTEKVSSDDFSKLLGANSIVLLAGEKGGDGAYAVRSLTALDLNSMMGGRVGGGGFPTGAGAGVPSGTPGAAGATGGNRPGGANPAGTPGAAGGNRPGGATGTGGTGAGASGGGARFALPGMGGLAGVVVRGGTLSGTKFSGNSLQGEAVTANLSETSSLQKQVTGTGEDLKPGISVTLTAPMAQAGQTAAQPEVTLITITDGVAG